MHWLELKLPPPLIFFLTAAGMWSAGGFPDLSSIAASSQAWLAIPFIALGGLCGCSALWSFLRVRTSVDPHHPAKATHLVVTGIYRYTRNPMYLALAFALLAWAFLLGNPLTLVAPLLFAGYITQFQILPEERILRECFGADYARYCQQVRRWL